MFSPRKFGSKPSSSRSDDTPQSPPPHSSPFLTPHSPSPSNLSGTPPSSSPTSPAALLSNVLFPDPLTTTSPPPLPLSTTEQDTTKKPLIPVPVMDDPFTSPRPRTVKALANMLETYNVIHVRGTPSSGKSTLALLLEKHLSKQGTSVALIPSWPRNKSYKKVLIDAATECGFTIPPGGLHNAEITFIVDEGQMSYFDHQFWLGFVKSQHGKFSGPRLAFFTSYGSPTQGPTDYPIGSPLAYLHPFQRVSITVSADLGASSPNVSLFLDEEEFQDMIQRLGRRESHAVPMTKEAVGFIWNLTRGHPGAVCSVLGAAKNAFHSHIKHIMSPVTAEMLQELVEKETFYERLRYGPVWRSFPPLFPGEPNSKGLSPEASSALRRAVRLGQVPYDPDDEGLKVCYQQGYLHLELDDSQLLLVFPTALHAKFCERFLTITQLPFPFQSFPTIRDLVIAAIRKLPRSMLLHTSRLGAAAIRRPPEATYQDAFRAALHLTLGFRDRVSSEWSGSDSGRIDFFVKGPGWGIEIMREGDCLQKHLERFSAGGTYYEWIRDGRMKDYLVLDFRTSPTKACNIVVPHLWRVELSGDEDGTGIFSNARVMNSENVTITDASGQAVDFPLII